MARPRKTAAKPADDPQDKPVEVVDPPAVNEAAPTPQVRAPAADPDQPPLKLKDFVAHHEQAAFDAGVVVAQISHPDAEPGVRQGKYSGIRMLEGNPSATYSDGSKH